jgi:hypothetical protein
MTATDKTKKNAQHLNTAISPSVSHDIRSSHGFFFVSARVLYERMSLISMM